MELRLSQDQEEYQKLAREFAQRDLTPKAHKFDAGDARGDFPADILKKAWETGLVGTQIPEKLGGLGLKLWDTCVILEELAYGCSGITAAIEASAIAQLPVLERGTDQQKELYLKPLIESPQLAGYALGGYESGRVVARQDGTDWVLTGRHPAIVNGGNPNSQWYFVLAAFDQRESTKGTTANPSSGTGSHERSWAAFVVPHNARGLHFEKRVALIGRKALTVSQVQFDDVYLEPISLIGQDTGGASVWSQCQSSMYSMIAAGCTGVAHCAMDNAVEYSKQRHTFGKPISSYQAVSFMLADMAREIEAARLMYWQSCILIDDGQKVIREAATAKAYAQEAAMRIATDAVQIYGGYGYSKEYPVEKLMRDAKTYQILEGTSQRLKAEIGKQLVSAV